MNELNTNTIVENEPIITQDITDSTKESLYQKLKEIVLEFKKEDFSNFEFFYNETKRGIFLKILSLIKNETQAEDILQDTYVKFLNNINNIDVNKSIIGYLLTIANNLVLDFFKKDNKLVSLDDERWHNVGVERTQTISRLNFLLEDCRKILKVEEYDIMILHVLNEYTFNEISKIVSKPIGTVLWIFNNAMKKLRKELKYENY